MPTLSDIHIGPATVSQPGAYGVGALTVLPEDDLLLKGRHDFSSLPGPREPMTVLVNGVWVTSSPYHTGFDLVCPEGTPVYNVAKGVFGYVDTVPDTDGKWVQVQAGKTFGFAYDSQVRIQYLHLSLAAGTVGQVIDRGGLVGLSGNTGLSTGPHLHFSIYVEGFGWVENLSVFVQYTAPAGLWVPNPAAVEAAFGAGAFAIDAPDITGYDKWTVYRPR